MFKKPTKKQLLIRRILLSVLATIAVAIIATASILFMLGYRLDNDNWQLEQGALLQFSSTPGGAQVYVNDGLVGTTSTKSTVVAGVHAIRFTHEGYEDWNRTVTLDAGTLTWLDYARMVPVDRPVQSVTSYDELAALEFSPDRKWALAQSTLSSPELSLIDLRAEQVRQSTLALAPSLYAESENPDVTHAFRLHQWSTAGRYVIFEHRYGEDGREWLMIDTQDASRSQNITQSLNVTLKDVHFASTSGMALFGLTSDNVVRKLDLSGGTITRGLITNVESFTVFEDTSVLSYVGVDPSDENTRVLGTYKDGDSTAHVIRTSSDPAQRIAITTGRYFNRDYVAISEGTKVTILTGNLPSNATDEETLRQFATFTTDEPVTRLFFNPSSSYVIAQYGPSFTSYELEHRRATTATLPGASDSTPRLRWLDNAHLWNHSDGSMVMRDFDGTNAHAILPALPEYGSTLSQNGRFIYAVGTDDEGGLQLQRVRMIL